MSIIQTESMRELETLSDAVFLWCTGHPWRPTGKRRRDQTPSGHPAGFSKTTSTETKEIDLVQEAFWIETNLNFFLKKCAAEWLKQLPQVLESVFAVCSICPLDGDVCH